MIKRLLLIAFVLLNVKVTVAISNSNSFNASTPPTLSNFRIEPSTPSRVYFDSSEPITASSAIGFTVSLKSISGVTINAEQSTDHYFTVSNDFTFWDNNTIRYEGGSDIQDLENNELHEFTLSYIVNNIPEPESTTDRYVTTSANGGGDGTSEGTAWTLEEAFSRATAGITVWVKAGDYGNQNLTLAHRIGTVENPIKFIGYKDNIGDIVDNYWDYGIPFDTSEMPTLTGSTTESGTALYIYNNHYVILRNIQLNKYKTGVLPYPNSGQESNEFMIFDRFNGYEFGSKTQANGTMFNILQWNAGITTYEGNDNFRIINSVIQNYSMAAVSIFGDGKNLIDNVKVFNDTAEKPDYQINVNGDNNIIRNCYVEIKNDYYSASTHGIGIRGSVRLSNTYNLIEKSTAVNINEGFYIRNYGCNYNVIKDNVVKNNGATSNYRGGVYIWGGANYNIVERMNISDVYTGIGFKDNNEEGNVNDNTIGHDNIIRNCTFNNFIMGISVVQQTSGQTGAVYDNKIINCTFNNGNWMFQLYFEDIKNLEFINCSITNLNYPLGGGYVYQNKPISGVNYTNCNFYGNNFTVSGGTGNISVDPKYVDPINNNLELQQDSELIDKGINIDDVNFDFKGTARPQGTSYDIGAYEDTTNTPTVGANVTICDGESTILIASGGTTYLWDTGEDTDSITVSPTETTTYNVDITNDVGTTTHSVIVTVNEAPTADTGSDITICNGDTTILTASGGDTYLWNTGETTESITVGPTETTTYSVISSNNGCTATASDDVIVTVNTIPNLNAGNDVELCIGSSTVLTASGSDNYIWSTGETTESIIINPIETTTYSVTSTLNGCSITDDVIVTVNDTPVVTAGDDVSICNGESITLTAEGIGNFIWSTGETTQSITVNPDNTTTYTVVADNVCGTEVSDDVIVTVNEVPTIDLGDNMEICRGESVTLTATGSGNSYIWSTGETTVDISVSPTETSTYSITSMSNNCSVTDEIVITVNDVPNVDLGPDITICNGESITLNAVGVGDFVWNTGETGTSITINPTETTTYRISSTNSTCGADVFDEVIVTVNEMPTVNAGVDVEICRGESITLTATGSGDSYIWSTGETTASITVSPTETLVYDVTTMLNNCSVTDDIVVTVNDVPNVELGSDISICYGESITLTAVGDGDFVWNTGETGASITISPTETTTYSIASTNSACGADVSDEVVVTVNETPAIDAGDDVTIEKGSSTLLTATGEGAFLWSTGESTQSITVSPESTTTYTVTATLNGACPNEDNVIVTVEDSSQQVVADAGDDVETCMNSAGIVLTANGGETYLWNTGENTQSITVNPFVTTIYAVTVSNSHSIDTDEVTVFVDEGCSGTGNRLSIIKEMKLYPNPTEGLLNIELSGFSDELNISLISLNGSIVYSESVTNYSPDKILKRQIDLSRFGIGVYFVRVTNNEEIDTKRVLVI